MITIKNKENYLIELIIEPTAEYIELQPNQEAVIKLTYLEDVNEDRLVIEYYKDSIVIYQEFYMDIKIFVEGDLKYYTDYKR